MSTIVSGFLTHSPHKVLERADIYSKTLQNFHELPLGSCKSALVRRLAEERKNEIDYSLQQSEYQNALFRRKEAADAEQRSAYERKIQSSREKSEARGRQLEKKHAKQAEVYEKHLKQVYRRYGEEQKKQRDHEKEESAKLKKELVEFYSREQDRKRKAAHRQVQVRSCYQQAVERINGIHRKNQEHSLKAEAALKQQMNKNNNFSRVIQEKRRSLSSKNKRKEITYRQSLDIDHGREHHFIQKCGSNEEGALSAWRHIDAECGKTTKRIGEFFKKRYERWSNQKKRVEEAREQVPQRCTGILSKTGRASFRHTVSTFRDTAQEWVSTVQRNKQAIRQFDQMNKDKIMSAHLDLRLTNTSTSKINDRMRVMRLQAKKLADDFL